MWAAGGRKPHTFTVCIRVPKCAGNRVRHPENKVAPAPLGTCDNWHDQTAWRTCAFHRVARTTAKTQRSRSTPPAAPTDEVHSGNVISNSTQLLLGAFSPTFNGHRIYDAFYAQQVEGYTPASGRARPLFAHLLMWTPAQRQLGHLIISATGHSPTDAPQPAPAKAIRYGVLDRPLMADR
jgi:hypothetical protein